MYRYEWRKSKELIWNNNMLNTKIEWSCPLPCDSILIVIVIVIVLVNKVISIFLCWIQLNSPIFSSLRLNSNWGFQFEKFTIFFVIHWATQINFLSKEFKACILMMYISTRRRYMPCNRAPKFKNQKIRLSYVKSHKLLCFINEL